MTTHVPPSEPVTTPEPKPAPDSVLTPDLDPHAQAEPVDATAPTPNIRKLGAALRRDTSIGITVLAVLATLYTLYFARAFVIPITFAVLLKFLLNPLIRALTRIHIPAPVGALIVVLALLAIIGGGAYAVSGPAQQWIAGAPQTLATAEVKLKRLRKPFERITRTAEQVENATSSSGGTPSPREVVLRGPTLVSRVFGTTESLLAGLLEMIVLLYFLLAGGDLFLQKLVKVLPLLHDKKTAVYIARETEASISTYLMTVALINVCEGTVVAGVMYLLGMPNPVLWGVLAMLLEFIPYLGALTMIAILTLAGLTIYNSIGHAFVAPAAFLGINVIQGNFVSPMLLGHRLTLNPVAIIVGLALWFFIWGVPGAFLAIPLLAAFKILCDHIEALAPIGEFLGKRDDDERRLTAR